MAKEARAREMAWTTAERTRPGQQWGSRTEPDHEAPDIGASGGESWIDGAGESLTCNMENLRGGKPEAQKSVDHYSPPEKTQE